jgi:hypothetical protein
MDCGVATKTEAEGTVERPSTEKTRHQPRKNCSGKNKTRHRQGRVRVGGTVVFSGTF